MKKFIQKILSNKRNVVILAILLFVFVAMATYTLIGISRSVQEMLWSQEEETPPYFPEYPPVDTQGRDPNVVKRGEYLAKAGDCMACHTNTPEKGKPFAGGLPMETPFGIIYTPNITPDRETGIGGWSTDQFITAMRRGISPRGHYYYPAFPYLYFNKISTSDLQAIKAYFDSIPAVRQNNRANVMVFPFNLRLMQLPWRLMFFHPEKVYVGVRQDTTAWDRGAYLVEGLGHCAMCHSPSYHILSPNLSLGAPMGKFNLTGAKIQGYLAPNISQSSLEKISNQEIIDVFTKDKLIGGGTVEGPMLEVNHDSLRYLTPADLDAIATYLKSVKSQTPPKPGSGKGAALAIYDQYCSGCHASGAGGAPIFGDPGSWSPILKNGLPKVYENAIQGNDGMPAKGTCVSCSDDDIKQTVNYMLDALKGKTATVVIPPKKFTMEDGKRIYEANCSVCHETGFKNSPKLGDKPAWKNSIDAGFIATFENVLTGNKGHPIRGACESCSDADLKAAVKYMMQESDPDKNYSLW